MKQKLNKNETITLIKKSTNIECYVEYKNNSFTIDLKGEIVPKQDQEITLKSIYELMNKKFDLIENEILLIKKENNKRFDLIENEILLIKKENSKRFDYIDNRLEIIERLPTISKEIKEKELYQDYSNTFKK